MIPTKMDPPEHKPFRAVLAKGLGIAAIRRIEPAVRRITAELVDGVIANGRCDFSAEYAHIFPIHVFMTMADLPLADAPELERFASGMTRPEGSTPAEMAEALDRANKSFFDYVAPISDARVGRPGEDVISVVVNTLVDGRPMTKDEALGMISLLLLAGLDTVVNFLSFMMQFLAENPKQRQELASDPDRIPQNTEELLRRFPLVAAARMVAKDIIRDGVQLKAGEMILLPTALSGLDERENPDPFRVDFDRRNIVHATFGDGPHRCAGMLLARLEISATLQEWLKRIPDFKIVEGTSIVCQSGVVALNRPGFAGGPTS